MYYVYKHKEKVVFFVLAVIVLLFTSECSFLYKINDCSDANVYLLGGKLLLNGKHLYSDFFEHKGIIVYFLHALSLIPFPNKFYGVYIFEVIAAYVFYLYSYKLCRLLDDNKHWLISVIETGIFCTIGYVSVTMTNGDEVEEFALPLIAYFIYYIVLGIKDNKWEYKAFVWVGVHIGLLFWAKFFCLLPHFLLFLGVVLYFIKQRDIKTLNILVLRMLLGIIVLTIPLLLYFVMTHSFQDMLLIYLYDNVFHYTEGKDRFRGFSLIRRFFFDNLILMPFYLGGLFNVLVKQKQVRFVGICHVLSLVIITLVNPWYYYYLITFAFIPIECFYLVGNLKPMWRYWICFIGLDCLLASYVFNPYYHVRNTGFTKQYEVAKIINQTDNPTLLVYAFDEGYYLAADCLPTDYYYVIVSLGESYICNHYVDLMKEGTYDYVLTKYQACLDNPNEINWDNETTVGIANLLTERGYEIVYSCPDYGYELFTITHPIVVLYKLQDNVEHN